MTYNQENDMKLSIIIVSYNTKDVTDNCLHSIFHAAWQSPFEVIVVDNHSTDGSVEMIKAKYPQVLLLANKENRMFAAANNQGAEIAKGQYLLLLNSDTIVYDDNLQKMIDFYDTLPSDVVCIGPKVLNQDYSVQSFGFPNPGLRERFCLCYKLHKLLPPTIVKKWLVTGLPVEPDNVREVGWVVGACMMIPKAMYHEVGGLNENVEFYGEEPEFGYRTEHRFHYRTIYYPGAEIIHLGGQSTGKIPKKTPDEIRLRRYGKLQKATVGYKKSIWMSYIVLSAAYVKRLVSTPSQRDYFSQAIAWEKKVIAYLKLCKKNEKGQ